MPEAQTAVTVSQLNNYIKQKLDGDANLANVWVKGEISNFTNHRSGHLYFSLKDEQSVVKAVMFASGAVKLAFKPESGMKVICRGRVSVYREGGQYQLYVAEMIPDGVGSLYIAYEQLKKKLESEGLFDASKKKKIPGMPLRVGVITSPTGAAVRDIINVCTRRFPLAKITLYPALVQGSGAPAELIEALRYFNAVKGADVIIIGRGGGSIEDLWGFNDEGVARAVYASEIPVISAVGHETDFTICDFVADLRAPTPSAAAELAVPDSTELIGKFANAKQLIVKCTSAIIERKKQTAHALGQRPVLTSPRAYVDDKKICVDNLLRRMDAAMSLSLQKSKTALGKTASKLDALSPLAVLSRGYAYVTKNGKLVKSVDDLQTDDLLRIDLSGGFAGVQVKDVTRKERV